MAVNFPTRDELNNSTKADIQSNLSGSNPFLRNSFLGAIATSFSLRIFDFYQQLQELLNQFLNLGSQFLTVVASWFGITQLAATIASGNTVAEGTAGTAIPISSTLTDSNGVEYTTTAAANISAQSITVTLARVGSVVTATASSSHNLANNINVTISGANETDYNGTFSITVISATQFTYLITTTPATPATGTISAAFNTALVPIQSSGSNPYGADRNQDAGTALTFSVPIPSVNEATYVPWEEITGGTDQETTEDFKVRTLDRIQNPIALFNVAAIENQVKLINGNTRVWVEEVTPAAGQVTVYFTRDDDGVIPAPGDVTTTKNKLLEIKPAHTEDADVIVAAPDAVDVPFSFSALSPNTSTMQASISASLALFFKERTEVGEDLTQTAYDSAIFNTIDTSTGERVASFTLSAPSGDVTIASGKLPTLGTIIYP
jgi:uncharacterized phage protein gp47/JayE